MPTTVRVFSPAKINLSLHVTGQRDDGYHILDSLVVFAGVGDYVTATRGTASGGFHVTGPRAAGVPTDSSNLVMKASRLMGPFEDVALTLEKHLPAASGVGGGSGDTAATLRALHQITGAALPDRQNVLSLGADVPVCLAGDPVRMRGVGEQLDPIQALPTLWIVLLNPGVEVPTPEVFARLSNRENPAMADDLPRWNGTVDFLEWLGTQRNDLQEPAISFAPKIEGCIATLKTATDCRLARMSGSGATCFGLFDTAEAARIAAQEIRKNHPGWWCRAAPVLGGVN